MKKIIATFFILTAFIINVRSQKVVGGEWSAGARLGGSSGLSIKHHSSSNKSAFEIIAANSFDKSVEGFTLTALFEKLAHLNNNGQLSAILGGGVNMNFKDQFKLGVSGIIGFDWRLKNLPLTLQLDWLPTWFFINEDYFSGVNAAFSIRYVLNRKKFARKK